MKSGGAVRTGDSEPRFDPHPRNRKAATSGSAQTSTADHRKKRIRPIIIYPFSHPRASNHLELLFGDFLKSLQSDDRFARPVTVINRQTHYRSLDPHDNNKASSYKKLRGLVESVSDIQDSWSVDTCAMWLTGFGAALDAGDVDDVFWLMPGDFHYDSVDVTRTALARTKLIPEKVYAGECQLCLGEISTKPNSAKQLIDTYGTYGLLYNWFPAEAQGIRQITTKPRSEFLAIDYEFLRTALVKERWYAYEQTIVILLQNMRGQRQVRPVDVVNLGEVEDDPSSRSTLSSAMQQIERTERVLKLFWRELNEPRHPGDWQDDFRRLESQSGQVRGAAMTIMQQLLS